MKHMKRIWKVCIVCTVATIHYYISTKNIHRRDRLRVTIHNRVFRQAIVGDINRCCHCSTSTNTRFPHIYDEQSVRFSTRRTRVQTQRIWYQNIISIQFLSFTTSNFQPSVTDSNSECPMALLITEGQWLFNTCHLLTVFFWDLLSKFKLDNQDSWALYFLVILKKGKLDNP